MTGAATGFHGKVGARRLGGEGQKPSQLRALGRRGAAKTLAAELLAGEIVLKERRLGPGRPRPGFLAVLWIEGVLGGAHVEACRREQGAGLWAERILILSRRILVVGPGPAVDEIHQHARAKLRLLHEHAERVLAPGAGLWITVAESRN